jgi:NAD+ synthase
MLPAIDIEKVTTNITDWIVKTVQYTGFSQLIIGVSGGIDSAVTISLAVRAVKPQNIYAVLMPYGEMNEDGQKDAIELLTYLKIPKSHIILFDILPAVETMIENIGSVDHIRKGNIMARIRMIYMFDLAKKMKALVCGTENKTEHLLGYFTRFGDAASDIEPIQSLYKTYIWDMAKYLQISEKILQKSPTAGLWNAQTDEEELGFSYKDADQVLYYHFEERLNKDAIVEKGISIDVVEKVLARVSANEFKHKLPYTFTQVINT